MGLGLPSWCQPWRACQCRRHEMWVWSMGWEDLEEGTATTPVFLPGESPMDRGAWQAMVHAVTKSQTWLEQLIMHAGMGLRWDKRSKMLFSSHDIKGTYYQHDLALFMLPFIRWFEVVVKLQNNKLFLFFPLFLLIVLEEAYVEGVESYGLLTWW